FPQLPTTELASQIGALAEMENGSPFSALAPMARAHASPVSYSGIYGLGEFPFHTDLAHWRQPPRYLLLRCVVGFKAVRTFLIDGRQLVDQLGASTFSRALVRPRRPRDGRLALLRPSDKTDP